jgi:hypothetical protein
VTTALPTHYPRGPHRAQDGRDVWLVMRRWPGLRHASASIEECLSEQAAIARCAALNGAGTEYDIADERRAA